MIIPRISEALDAEALRQRQAHTEQHRGVPPGLSMDILSFDAESLALAAIEEIANQLAKEGFSHPARWLRSQITDGKR